MAAQNAVLNAIVEGDNPQEVRAFSRNVADLIDRPIGRVKITAADKVGNVRTVTLQVVNRLKFDRPGHWIVEWYIATTSEGAPGGTQTVAAPSTGTALSTVIANKMYRTLTDATGKIVVDITQAGAATLFIHAQATGRCDPPLAGLAW